MTITEAQCDALLAADLAPVEAVIGRVKVPVTQNEFDALVSLGFNIGIGGLGALARAPAPRRRRRARRGRRLHGLGEADLAR